MKFILFAPTFTHNSGGIKALYLLGEYLIDLGHDVQGCNYQDRNAPPPIGCRVKFSVEQDTKNAVAIVPETLNIETNLPVLRWVLNHPGLLGGPKCYGANEMVVYYTDTFAESAKAAAIDGVAHEMCIGVTEPLTDSGKARIFDLWYEGKGASDSSHEIDAIRVTRQWPPTRAELFLLFERCENFYSYDDCSGTNIEAHLAGCNVYIRKNCEWVSFVADRLDRYIANPTRDRENVRRAVAIVEAALI
jgi:hypothetical protein